MGNKRNITRALKAMVYKTSDSTGHSVGYELDHQEITVHFVAKATHFSLFQSIHTGSGAHQVSY